MATIRTAHRQQGGRAAGLSAGHGLSGRRGGRSAGPRRPSCGTHLSAALSVIPPVPLQLDSQGAYLDQTLTITVTIAGRRPAVAVRYPAGRIAFERRPVEAGWETPDAEKSDDALGIDRRKLEETLSQMESELGAAGPADPKLRKAQQLMYRELSPVDRGSIFRARHPSTNQFLTGIIEFR